jgi:glycosyltransferase involved in cell wall biosynthesis
MPPKVSIVTTTYNGEKYIEESIGSILSQTFDDFEFIIVDDGSTDNTLETLRKMDDPRIRIIQQKNHGQTRALIVGVKQAQGELIARIDQDDYSLSNRLMCQVNFMDTHSNVTLCGSRFEELYGDNLVPQRVQFAQTDAEIKKIISFFNPLAHSAVMFRRDAYSKIGGYDKRFAIGMDYDLFIRLMEIGEVHNLEEVLTVIRMHDESHSTIKSRLKTMESIKIRRRAYSNFGGNPLLAGYFFLKSITGLILPPWVKSLF